MDTCDMDPIQVESIHMQLGAWIESGFNLNFGLEPQCKEGLKLWWYCNRVLLTFWLPWQSLHNEVYGGNIGTDGG